MRGPGGAGAGRQSPQHRVFLPHRLRGAASALRIWPRPKVAALLQPCPKTLLLHVPCTATFNSELARVKYFSLSLTAVACLAAQSSPPLGSPGPRDCPVPRELPSSGSRPMKQRHRSAPTSAEARRYAPPPPCIQSLKSFRTDPRQVLQSRQQFHWFPSMPCFCSEPGKHVLLTRVITDPQ